MALSSDSAGAATAAVRFRSGCLCPHSHGDLCTEAPRARPTVLSDLPNPPPPEGTPAAAGVECIFGGGTGTDVNSSASACPLASDVSAFAIGSGGSSGDGLRSGLSIAFGCGLWLCEWL